MTWQPPSLQTDDQSQMPDYPEIEPFQAAAVLQNGAPAQMKHKLY